VQASIALLPQTFCALHIQMAVMAHIYVYHIQQICNMTKGRQRIKILGAKGTLVRQ